MKYDPNQAPDPQRWLQTDEMTRLEAVSEWIEEHGFFDSNETQSRAAILSALESQIAGADPDVVATTLQRLTGAGLERGRALFAMAGVLDQIMAQVLSKQSDFDLKEYQRRLEALDIQQIEHHLAGSLQGSDSSQAYDPGLQQRLEAFAERHADQGAPTFPTLAGFLFAVLCAPSVVPPSVWLPQILGDVSFSSDEEAEQTVDAIMALLNWVASQVHAEDGDPLPSDCIPDPDPMANLEAGSRFGQWCEGVSRAQVELEQVWLDAVGDDTERKNTLGQFFMTFGFFASKDLAIELHSELIDHHQSLSLEEMAAGLHGDIPDVIAEYIDLGIELRRASPRRPAKAHVRSSKVGRNAPCPCGSGKKYKKCCGKPGQ